MNSSRGDDACDAATATATAGAAAVGEGDPATGGPATRGETTAEAGEGDVGGAVTVSEEKLCIVGEQLLLQVVEPARDREE